MKQKCCENCTCGPHCLESGCACECGCECCYTTKDGCANSCS